MLGTDDIPIRAPRIVRPTTEYPEGQRFTLQIIEILEGLEREIVVHACKIGCDAVFSRNTPLSKPSDILLNYNYGAAAIKWWGHHTELLQSRAPRPLAPGPSTAPRSNLRPRPAATTSVAVKKREGHSKSHNSQKKGVLDPSAADASKPWESWDEDDWIFYCMLNTKATRERQQAAQEESSSNVRAWAQEVAGSQGTGL